MCSNDNHDDDESIANGFHIQRGSTLESRPMSPFSDSESEEEGTIASYSSQASILEIQHYIQRNLLLHYITDSWTIIPFIHDIFSFHNDNTYICFNLSYSPCCTKLQLCRSPLINAL